MCVSLCAHARACVCARARARVCLFVCLSTLIILIDTTGKTAVIYVCILETFSIFMYMYGLIYHRYLKSVVNVVNGLLFVSIFRLRIPS